MDAQIARRVDPNNRQNVDRVMEAGIGWTKDMDYDEEVLFRTLYGLRRLSAEKPFLLCVSFTGPHYPYVAPRDYWDLYADDDVDCRRCPPTSPAAIMSTSPGCAHRPLSCAGAG